MLVYAYPAVGRGGWRTFWRRRLLAVVLPYATWTVVYFALGLAQGPARQHRRRRRAPGVAAAHRVRPALLPGHPAAVLPDLPGVPVAAPADAAAALVAARRQPRGGGGAVPGSCTSRWCRPDLGHHLPWELVTLGGIVLVFVASALLTALLARLPGARGTARHPAPPPTTAGEPGHPRYRGPHISGGLPAQRRGPRSMGLAGIGAVYCWDVRRRRGAAAVRRAGPARLRRWWPTSPHALWWPGKVASRNPANLTQAVHAPYAGRSARA